MEKKQIYDLLHEHFNAMSEYYDTKSNKLKFLLETRANGIVDKLLNCYKITDFEALQSDLDIKDDWAYRRCLFYTEVKDSFEKAVTVCKRTG